jgi:hypothetical protein
MRALEISRKEIWGVYVYDKTYAETGARRVQGSGSIQ